LPLFGFVTAGTVHDPETLLNGDAEVVWTAYPDQFDDDQP
jgi:hypothetical protein